MSKIFLSVVIPSYDEMTNLRTGVLDRVDSFLSKKNFSYEVIVVDDGSTDGGIEFVSDFAKTHPEFRLLKNSHTGKAGAVTAGILSSVGEYVLFTDMDQAAPIKEVDRLLPFFDKGFDIVIGSRSSTRKGAPWTRTLMALGMIILRKSLIGLSDISDTQCGFKMFRNSVAQKLFSKVSKLHGGFNAVSGSSVSAGFDVELLYVADKMKYKIKEVPVEWMYVETRRVNPIKDSIEAVLDLVRIKKNDLSGVYDI